MTSVEDLLNNRGHCCKQLCIRVCYLFCVFFSVSGNVEPSAADNDSSNGNFVARILATFDEIDRLVDQFSKEELVAVYSRLNSTAIKCFNAVSQLHDT
jgi:hypothetical protein